MTPQAGQHGTPLVEGQRARMNQQYASSSFIAATFVSGKVFACGVSRKC